MRRLLQLILFTIVCTCIPSFTQSYNVNVGGIQFSSGVGVPGSCGRNGAFYYNTSNSSWYECVAGTWTIFSTGGGTGTVTSVTFTGDGVVDSSTPSTAVTASGTVLATIKTQTQNTVFAGSNAGGTVAPTFRALVLADLPGTVVNASSPGAGLAHFAGSTQTVTSSLVVAADITTGTITGTQLSPTITLGTDNSVAGTLTEANSAANAHTIWGSGATTTNTIQGFAAVPTTGRLIDCTVTSTTCLLHDSGVTTANVVNASSPGVGLAHFAGSTQTVTSSLIVAADITSATITGTQLAASLALTTPNIGAATGTTLSLGTDNSVAGTVTLANSAASAHTIFSSGATTTNTIAGFTAVPTTLDLVTCTSAATTCTLTDSGILATNIVRKDAANTGATGMTLNMAASTTANSFVVPIGAGLTSGTDGAIAYDTTQKNTHIRTNGADTLAVAETAAQAAGVILKSASATKSLATASSITDDATTVTTTEPLVIGTAGGTPHTDKTIGYSASAMGAQTTATCTNITSMTWTIAASKNYRMTCEIPVTLAATATLQFCLNGPGSPTHTSLDAWGPIGAAGVYFDGENIGTTSWGGKTTASGAAANTSIVHVTADIQNGSTASGTALTLQTAANGTNAITVLADAVCDLKQVN